MFDPKKFKASTDNGRWAETDLITALKVATMINSKRKSIAEMLLNPPGTPLHEVFESGVDYTAEEINENGAHVKLRTNLDKISSALAFINEGKHPSIKKANFVTRINAPLFTDTIELKLIKSNGDEIVIRYIDGKIVRSVVETMMVTRERLI